MALESWLASLKADVSGVSGVQAPIDAGLGRYVTDTAGVSDVSVSVGMVAGDTPDTAAQNQTYQAQPAWALGCTCDTADTCEKANGECQTTEVVPTPNHSVPKRISRPRGPWLKEGQALNAKPYHAHHFHCLDCISAGRGIRYGRRCAVGLALWSDYTGADTNGDLQTEGGDRGQA